MVALQDPDEQRGGGDAVELGKQMLPWEENAARWWVLCDQCMEEEGIREGVDEIGLNRVASYGHLLAWTAHLMEKNWLDRTTWRQLIARYTEGVNP